MQEKKSREGFEGEESSVTVEIFIIYYLHYLNVLQGQNRMLFHMIFLHEIKSHHKIKKWNRFDGTRK